MASPPSPKRAAAVKKRPATHKKAKRPVCHTSKKGVKHPKGCVTPKRKRPSLTPKARPVALPANPAVSARQPLPVPTGTASPVVPASVATVPVVPVAAAPPAALPVRRAFTLADAERLLWRAGFGPKPGDLDRLVALGLDGAVASLVHPVGAATLVGPAPRTEDGNALAPADLWGQDHCWWLDRMVRSDQPLVERMTLVWHDWFATSDEKVGNQQRMLDQNALLRRHALGSFGDLLREIGRDPAMLFWLDGVDNSREEPNENHARELMELFTLGAGRGAYSEDDVRELARVMTGWRTDWRDGVGWTNFRFDASRHDPGTKTVFGRTGTWAYDDAARLCLEHPAHAGFFVTKLWGSFIGEPLPADDAAALAAIYVGGGHQVAPVLEAILKHPLLYDGASLVKPPVVLAAGLMRASQTFVTTTDWAWLGLQAGQMLFRPPNVSGWDDSSWLDTSTWRARWDLTLRVFYPAALDPWQTPWDVAETPDVAVTKALAFAGDPHVTPEQRAALLSFATTCLPAVMASWELAPRRVERQNALRLLVLTAADYQVS